MTNETKKQLGDLCRSGALVPFWEACDETLKGFDEISFTTAEKLVYSTGKRHGAQEFADMLRNTIEVYAKQ